MDTLVEARIAGFLKDIPQNVKVVAATKFRSAELIRACPSHGIFAAGENRVQELLSKYEPIEGLEWHYIGQLQTNKVKYIVDKVSLIQSVDRENLVTEIDEQCRKKDKIMPVLIEVNFGGGEARGGVMPENMFELAERISESEYLKLKGLMTVLPLGSERSATLYRRAYTLFVDMKKNFGKDVEWLSMGMSLDYKIAIDNGANMIRPGRVLFGERNGFENA